MYRLDHRGGGDSRRMMGGGQGGPYGGGRHGGYGPPGGSRGVMYQSGPSFVSKFSGPPPSASSAPPPSPAPATPVPQSSSASNQAAPPASAATSAPQMPLAAGGTPGGMQSGAPVGVPSGAPASASQFKSGAGSAQPGRPTTPQGVSMTYPPYSGGGGGGTCCLCLCSSALSCASSVCVCVLFVRYYMNLAPASISSPRGSPLRFFKTCVSVLMCVHVVWGWCRRLLLYLQSRQQALPRTCPLRLLRRLRLGRCRPHHTCTSNRHNTRNTRGLRIWRMMLVVKSPSAAPLVRFQISH